MVGVPVIFRGYLLCKLPALPSISAFDTADTASTRSEFGFCFADTAGAGSVSHVSTAHTVIFSVVVARNSLDTPEYTRSMKYTDVTAHPIPFQVVHTLFTTTVPKVSDFTFKGFIPFFITAHNVLCSNIK